MTTDFIARVHTDEEPALCQSSRVPPTGNTLTWFTPSLTAYTIPVAFISSIVVLAAPSFGIVENDKPVPVVDANFTSRLLGVKLPGFVPPYL